MDDWTVQFEIWILADERNYEPDLLTVYDCPCRYKHLGQFAPLGGEQTAAQLPGDWVSIGHSSQWLWYSVYARWNTLCTLKATYSLLKKRKKKCYLSSAIPHLLHVTRKIDNKNVKGHDFTFKCALTLTVWWFSLKFSVSKLVGAQEHWWLRIGRGVLFSGEIRAAYESTEAGELVLALEFEDELLAA